MRRSLSRTAGVGKVRRLLGALFMSLVAFTFLPVPSASAAPAYIYWDNAYDRGFYRGGWSLAADGANLVFQNDGNLVLYNSFRVATFASNTQGRGNVIKFQMDGNIVIYDAGMVPVWYTGSGIANYRDGFRYRLGSSKCGAYGAHFIAEQRVRSGQSFPFLTAYDNYIWKAGSC